MAKVRYRRKTPRPDAKNEMVLEIDQIFTYLQGYAENFIKNWTSFIKNRRNNFPLQS